MKDLREQLQSFTTFAFSYVYETYASGMLITAKDTLPEELWRELQEAKLTKFYGEEFAKNVDKGKSCLSRASGKDQFNSQRHNQYIVNK